MRKIQILMFSLLEVVLNACAAQTSEKRIYRGDAVYAEKPLGANDHYSFRFVEKWRISHAWLTGPIDIRGCVGYGSNSFKRLGGYGALDIENMEPLIEIDGFVYAVYEHKGRFSAASPHNFVYGTNREGKFEGFHAFCSHLFTDTYDGVGLYIVKPDAAKGTDEWISGAQIVTVNGLQWLHRSDAIQDWSKSHERLAAPIETWVLKIPDTPYWLKLNLNSSSGATDRYGKGANAFPEKHQKIVDLFHQIVESVKLEPITPIDISPLIKEVR
jgi:hypothetical protein